MKTRIVLGALLSIAFAIAPVTVGAQEGDPEAGEVKASSCLGCHGIPGYYNVYPTYRVPRVGGQHAQYIINALNAYKNGERSHRTMQVQAATLSDQDMADIAAFFAAAKKD